MIISKRETNMSGLAVLLSCLNRWWIKTATSKVAIMEHRVGTNGRRQRPNRFAPPRHKKTKLLAYSSAVNEPRRVWVVVIAALGRHGRLSRLKSRSLVFVHGKRLLEPAKCALLLLQLPVMVLRRGARHILALLDRLGYSDAAHVGHGAEWCRLVCRRLPCTRSLRCRGRVRPLLQRRVRRSTDWLEHMMFRKRRWCKSRPHVRGWCLHGRGDTRSGWRAVITVIWAAQIVHRCSSSRCRKVGRWDKHGRVGCGRWRNMNRRWRVSDAVAKRGLLTQGGVLCWRRRGPQARRRHRCRRLGCIRARLKNVQRRVLRLGTLRRLIGRRIRQVYYRRFRNSV